MRRYPGLSLFSRLLHEGQCRWKDSVYIRRSLQLEVIFKFTTKINTVIYQQRCAEGAHATGRILWLTNELIQVAFVLNSREVYET